MLRQLELKNKDWNIDDYYKYMNHHLLETAYLISALLVDLP